MTTIAFIGLGIMGGPMAANLVKAGLRRRRATTAAPTRSRRSSTPAAGGADDVAEAVREADVVVTMVPDSPDVEAVTGGEDGVFANARQGALYIDLSSIRPDVSVRVAEAGQRRGPAGPRRPGQRRRGRRHRGQPVDHGRRRAPTDFEEARPVLDAVGKTVVHVGPARLGPDRQGGQPAHRGRQHRAARRGDRLPRGLRRRHQAALEVLGGGLAGSTVLDRKGANMLAGEFEPGFRIALHHKDMGIVTSRRPRGRRGHPARRGGRPADRRHGRPRRRRPRPLGPAQAGPGAVRRDPRMTQRAAPATPERCPA